MEKEQVSAEERKPVDERRNDGQPERNLVEQFLDYLNFPDPERPDLPEFVSLKSGLVVFASGSPRSGRFAIRFGTARGLVVKLPQSSIRERIASKKLPLEFQEAARVAASFEEHSRQWWYLNERGEATDGDLSLAKARIATAAAILLTPGNEIPAETFYVIGKDYNLAPGNLRHFLDRSGYRNLGDRGYEPIEPLDQLLMLYLPAIYYENDFRKEEPPPPFYVANSVTLLRCNLNGKLPGREELEDLVDISRPLDLAWVTAETSLSFMAVRPDRDIIGWETRHTNTGLTVFQLFEFYTNMPWRENYLYGIPGAGVDWSRPPFCDHLEVFVADNSPIRSSLKRLRESLSRGDGSWEKFHQFSSSHPIVADELVGFPTWSLKSLWQ